MLYASYIFPPEKKAKEKEVEEVIEETKSKTSKRKKHFGSAPEASDLPTEEKLARAEAHLIELRNKIDRLINDNTILQDYLDERPDLHFDTAKTCCLDQNEDFYNWVRLYDKLIEDFNKMPGILKEKESTLNSLKEQHNELMTEYENLEERELLTKQLKERAVVCNEQLEEEVKKMTNMQERLSWMEDYHKIQISGEVAILKREQEKQKFSINFYKKLCEKLEESNLIPNSPERS